MVGIKTDVGIVRSLNEDCVGYIEKNGYSVFIVADGMGGHNAGEVASKMAVDIIKEYIEENIELMGSAVLKKAIKDANIKIYNEASKNDKLKGMGTTIVACLILNENIYIANVGDSQGYRIIEDKIIKITRDHSLVQELIDSGSISEEQGRVHPKKNIITRALGTNDFVEVDIFTIEKDKKSKFLLCTDGLTNDVLKDEILLITNEYTDYNEACENLVCLAKQRGGKDNITVLLFGGEV